MLIAHTFIVFSQYRNSICDLIWGRGTSDSEAHLAKKHSTIRSVTSSTGAHLAQKQAILSRNAAVSKYPS